MKNTKAGRLCIKQGPYLRPAFFRPLAPAPALKLVALWKLVWPALWLPAWPALWPLDLALLLPQVVGRAVNLLHASCSSSSVTAVAAAAAAILGGGYAQGIFFVSS